VHSVLARAIAAAKAKAPKRVHLDGPDPLLGIRELVSVALWCVDWLSETSTDADGKRVRAIVAELRSQIDAPVDFPRDRFEWNGSAWEIGIKDRELMGVFERVTVVWNRYVAKQNRYVGEHVEKYVARYAAEIAAARTVGEDFVRDLDAQLVRAEWLALKPSRPDATLLWRGVDARKKLAHVLGRDGDLHVLLTKQKNRWRWFEGTRDDILATIPDASFASAMRALDGQ
jgi:hypothetical protein